MNFEFNPRDAEFRAEVRSFISAKLPELFQDCSKASLLWGFHRPYMQKWIQALSQKGWSVPSWPAEWGGANWPLTWHSILQDEMVAADCPPTDVIGTGFVGPVIYTFGTEDQKRRYLPRIRNGEDFWCQGFSEQDAGSDVMSLRTTGTCHGKTFIVNGRKLWISNAHNADMMFALVRIDAPGNRRQQGLSFLLIDMHTLGITVRPVITIDGIHRVNEVILEDAEVPIENLVGEQGKGWVYARFLLARERAIVAGPPMLRRMLRAFRGVLSSERRRGAPLSEDPGCRLRLAQFEAELSALEFLELRILHAPPEDSESEVLASMLKLRGSELRQRLCEAVWDAFGHSGLEFSARTAEDASQDDPIPEKTHWSAVNHLFARSATLIGGTSEIQRNIIAGVSLGL